jgi:sugar lactone lactonase YvrE
MKIVSRPCTGTRGFSRVIFTLWLAAVPMTAQLPPSGTLSAADLPFFRAAVADLEKRLPTAPDQCALTYEIAKAYASAKQWPETLDWLRRVADLKAGLDPTRDSAFADLRNTKEFAAIANQVRNATPPLSHSKPAFQVTEGDLLPESVAYDPARRQFYFGSMRKGTVTQCSAAGDCRQFAGGLGVVVGLKTYGQGLWVLNNAKESELIHYDLASGQLSRRYPVSGAPHGFNDLTFAPSGDIYLTDTPAGAVWRLANGAAELSKIPGKFPFANGIAISSDGSLLYVASYPDGIFVVDLKTSAPAPIPHPAALCLATIDGLYFHRGSLIAIQNAFMTPRVVRFDLTRDHRSIARFEVLERCNPLFDGVTTGVIAGNDFYYMANIQEEKKTNFDPIRILKIHL